jgi:hypothetical protein
MGVIIRLPFRADGPNRAVIVFLREINAAVPRSNFMLVVHLYTFDGTMIVQNFPFKSFDELPSVNIEINFTTIINRGVMIVQDSKGRELAQAEIDFGTTIMTTPGDTITFKTKFGFTLT